LYFTAANPETIHTHSSSVYGVLDLEESHFTEHFTHALMQENSKLTVLSAVIMCTAVLDTGNWRTTSLEGNPRDQYAVAV